MSIITSNARLDKIARDVVQILNESTPNFPFERISDICLSAGLFNAQEADNLFKNALFPGWFIEKLYYALPRPIEFSGFTSNSCEVVSLSDSGNLALTPPAAQSVFGNRTEIFNSRSLPIPEMFVVRSNQATHYVSPWLSVSWSNDGVIGPRVDQSARFLLNFMQDTEPRHLPGHTFTGVVKWSNNYTHWLLDTFPRFLALIEAGIDIDNFDQIILFRLRYDFQKNMLKELGIDLERVITTLKQGLVLKTDEITFASNPRMSHVASANVYDMLCTYFGQPLGKRLGERKLFLSRSKTCRRRITNEDEVVAFLEPLGYERVWMEDIGIREGARMMAEANSVIAPHGAAMANLVFCAPGTKVLELFNSHFTKDYWIISNQKKLKYFVFEADGPDGKKMDSLALEKLRFRDRQFDMTVSMNEFIDFVINEFERE